MTNFDKDMLLRGYLATALWAESKDDQGNGFDSEYSIEDFSEDAFTRAENDVDLFVSKAGNLLHDDLDPCALGHDFWLTRNHHGAGFWDGDYPKELGDTLTNIAQSFPSLDVYVGDDGMIYFG